MPSEIIDQANELVEQNINQAIQAHRINHNAVSAEHCEECGEDIPQVSRVAAPGCQTCADCQSLIELRRKQRGM
ncbi:TraR/DksA family transcriptional regulator [Salmonella enterica]|uniref:TraR/DksA family transcriptional regulator n=1 Tax=Salmonella enterica subsp. enterica serovar Saintpaul TaxID=90105 RepID=A0A5W5JML8_SALET|nr:TraR/DksA family transcriptional regulator [Salmonella enterica]EBX1943150.1 TraR/DksA family transcriptional regulator [Salmonella enterica subsp. enterica serovar Saintpaul]EAT8462352.1 TraR/DksA family transcriptional regulator [Salmonella enterica]EAW5279922.1 TraR/DksA family transcriptional regulator [Salmonella enterica]EBN2770817.1 TraR/DksA family transcriptional regulator [Salmonella enterica]